MQLPPQRPRRGLRPVPVVEDAHRHALPCLFLECLGEAAAYVIGLEDVVLQVYPLLGAPDLFEPFIVGLWAVLEQREAVTLA